jgi:hypothetical protein
MVRQESGVRRRRASPWRRAAATVPLAAAAVALLVWAASRPVVETVQAIVEGDGSPYP